MLAFTKLALGAACVSALQAPAPQRAATKLYGGIPELKGMNGLSVETGNSVFDPLDLSQWRDVNELRESEIANGRSAMLAVVGWVWPQVFGLWKGGPVTTTDPIDAIAAVPSAAWGQMVLFCGILEAAKYNWKNGVERDPSKPFFDPFSLYPEDAKGREEMELKEIKNGRMAMIAFAGLVTHHFMPGAVPLLGGLH